MFGKYLRSTRERAELTVNELARLASVDHGYLSKLENNLRPAPSQEFLDRIQPHLKVSMEELKKEAGYIKVPKGQAHIIKSACLADEYINKGMTEAQIRRILDSFVAALDEKVVEK
jgi:transcriptional regulator with XRE-family HTH domain